MVDTFTNNFNLVLQATGSNGGTWGTDWNNNGTTPIDSILGGTQPIVMSGSNVTLTLTQWQNGAFKITGTLTANVQLILPLSPNSVGGTPGVGGKFIVDNETTGAFTITVLTAATGSTGVVAPQGFRTHLYSDTVNVWYVSPVGPASLTTLAVSGAAVFASTVNISGAVTIGTGKLSLTSTDSMAMANGTTGQRNGSPSAGDTRYNSTLGGLEYWSGTLSTWITLGQQPTVQRFTAAGSGNYTPSAGMARIRARMWAAGAGGGAQNTNNGSNATGSSFGNWTTNGGSGGQAGNGGQAGGAGGTGGTNGTGTLVDRFPGGPGGTGLSVGGGAVTSGGGGPGGATSRAGWGLYGTLNAQTNSGCGGAGFGATSGSEAAGGGGAGEFVEFWMTAAQVAAQLVGGSLPLVVGTHGAGGAAGGNAGGNGADGLIIVEEFYS